MKNIYPFLIIILLLFLTINTDLFAQNYTQNQTGNNSSGGSGCTVTLTFTGTPVASGNATLQVLAGGDIDGTGGNEESYQAIGEVSTNLGTGGATGDFNDQCDGLVASNSFTISQAQVNSWRANGSITISFVFNNNVNCTLCTGGSAISATLSYSSCTPPTPATSISNTDLCTNPITLTSVGGNSGTNGIDVWYEGSCNTAFAQNWSTQPYGFSSTTVNSVNNGILRVTSTGVDPIIDMANLGSFNPSIYRYMNIRYRVISGIAGNTEIFFYNGAHNFAVGGETGFGALNSDGQWRTLSIDMHQDPQYTTGGNILGWRYDWATASGVTMEIDYISLDEQPIIAVGSSIDVSPSSATIYFNQRRGDCGVTSCISKTVTPISITGTTTLCVGATSDLNASGEAAWSALPTGGNISTLGTNERVHTFNSTSIFNTPQSISGARLLVVGGGGGGGVNGGGGGGAGGVFQSSDFSISAGNTPATVGAGGSVHLNTVSAPARGGQSAFGVITAGGGGGGTSRDVGPGGTSGGAGTASGSGGGGAGSDNAIRRVPGAGTFSGGNGSGFSCNSAGGGGGGAGGNGGNASPDVAGAGGIGVQSNITGINLFYAAGGGGGLTGFPGCGSSTASNPGGALGGSGIGGNGEASAGATNTGSGGGAERVGGSGVVIVRYAHPLWTSSNPSVATVNSTSGLVTGVSSGTTDITYLSITGCSLTETITVQSTDNNPGAISVPSQICIGTPTNISNVTSASTGSPSSSGPEYFFYYRGGPSNIGWQLFEGPTSNASSTNLPSALINTPGQWFVARNSQFGCTNLANDVNTSNIPLLVSDNPSSAVAGTTPQLACLENSLTLNATSPSVGTGTWSWTPTTPTYVSGSATDNNAQVAFSASGTYTGTWEVTSGACTPTTDNISIEVNNPSGIALGNATGTCESDQVNDWVHLYNSSGEIIASINDNNQNLGDVTAQVFYNGGNAFEVSTDGSGCGTQAVLNRSFVINSTTAPSAPVGVRLYFTDAELTNLIALAGCNDLNGCADDDDICDINGLYVTQISGASSEDGVFSVGDGTPTLHTPSNSGTGNNNFNANYVEFNVTSFSEFWLHGSESGVPLPVELLSFSASAIDNEYIQLDWQTTTEINNEGFEIEKSLDGVNFETIAWVDGNGNTTNIQDYQLNDYEANNGINYYRLKQIDFDGKFEYAPIISAKLLRVNALLVSNLRPNPAKDEVFFDIEVDEFINTNIIIYNQLGQQVYTQSKTFEKGNNEVKINTSSFAAGSYLLTIESDKAFITKRFIVSK